MMEKLYINTEDASDIVTLEEIKRRYKDIQGMVEGFDEYVASGFVDGITAEYRELQTELQEIGKAIIKRQTELLEENREDWELGRYSINKAWEEAIKEICLLK